MTDNLLNRLDRYVISLLNEIEAQDCTKPAEGDTSAASEEGPASSRPATSLSDRIALLKAATTYIQVRAGKVVKDEPEQEPPEIDGFITKLRPKQHRAARG